MVNKNRIVPVLKIDLLSLYATIVAMTAGAPIKLIKAKDVAGSFEANNVVEYDGYSSICNQPVKTLVVTELDDAQIYFTASFDFEGVTYNGVAVEPDDTIVKDAATLYIMDIDGGEPTIKAVAPFVE